MSSSSFDRYVPHVIFLLIVLNAVVLYSVALVPFVDVPSHLAEAAIYKYIDDPSALISQYYTAVPWYYPNTFHTVFCSLFPSVELGNKTFYVLYVAGLLVSVDRVVKELGGNRWYSLLSVLFLYGYNVTYGFSGYTIAIPATLFLFLVVLKDMKAESTGYKGGAAFLLILLYLMHAQMALFGLVLYAALMMYRWWGSFKKMAVNIILVSLPVIVVVIIWWMNRSQAAQALKDADWYESSTSAFLIDYYKQSYLPEFWLRFRLLVFDNFSLRAGAAGLLLAGFLFFLMLLPLLYYKAWRGVNKQQVLKSNLTYALIFLGIGLGCYLVLPYKLPGQAPLYERFSTVVVFAIIIAGSVLLKGVQAPLLRYFVIGAVVLYSCLWTEYLYAFDRENEDFTPSFFSGIPKEAKVGGLIYDYQWRGRAPYMHFPNYYTVWNKGAAASKIIDYRFGVVRRGERGGEIPPFNEWIGKRYNVEKAYDTTLHYLLVRGQAPVQPDSNLLNYQLVKSAGAWQLYKNLGLK